MPPLRAAVVLVALLGLWPGPITSAAAPSLTSGEYAGTTPCDEASRAFVGGIPSLGNPAWTPVVTTTLAEA